MQFYEPMDQWTNLMKWTKKCYNNNVFSVLHHTFHYITSLNYGSYIMSICLRAHLNVTKGLVWLINQNLCVPVCLWRSIFFIERFCFMMCTKGESSLFFECIKILEIDFHTKARWYCRKHIKDRALHSYIHYSSFTLYLLALKDCAGPPSVFPCEKLTLAWLF